MEKLHGYRGIHQTKLFFLLHCFKLKYRSFLSAFIFITQTYSHPQLKLNAESHII